MDVLVSNTDLIASGDDVTFQMSIGTTPTALLTFADPRTFAEIFVETAMTTSGATQVKWPLRHSFQDKGGYGYLLASDNFHVSADSTGQAGATISNWKLYYRFVDIPLTEFVGIVQSTQQT